MPRGKYAYKTDYTDTVTDFIAEDTVQMNKSSVTLVNGSTAGEAELFCRSIAGVRENQGGGY